MRPAVISYPKSGRTWLRGILDDLGIEAEYTHAGAEHKAPLPVSELNTSEAERFARIVFLTRDPRDTVVSAYHQARWRDRKRYAGTISEFIRDPLFGIEKIVRYNAMWLGLTEHNESILHLTYETMHENIADAVARAVDHFAAAVSPEAVSAAISRNAFAAMREREIAGDFDRKYRGRLGMTEPGELDSLKCRRGVIGSYLDELSAGDIAYCEQIMSVART